MRLSRRRVTGWGAFNHSDLPLLARDNEHKRMTDFEALNFDHACVKQLVRWIGRDIFASQNEHNRVTDFEHFGF